MDGNSTSQPSQRLATIVAVLTFCAGFVGAQEGHAAGVWTNEPAGASVLLDCPFSGNVCQMFNVYGNQPFASDSSAPVSPTGILDEVLEAGAGEGGGQFIYELQAALGKTAREVYVGTLWKTNPEFEGNLGGIANKLLFISGAGNNNFLNWLGPRDSPKQLLWANQSVQNNCHVSGWAGGCGADGYNADSGVFLANGSSNGSVSAGTGWHLIEIYQKASTTGTSRDGIIKWWLDRQLVGSYTNVNLSPGGFTNVQYNHTWDGYPCTGPLGRDCSRAWHHMWDHLHISVGGGSSVSDQPPGPPASPTMRSVTTP